MTAKERKEIAEKMAEILYDRISEQLDEMLPLKRVIELYGWSKAYIYQNRAELGGVKAGGKLFFSRRNIELIIRHGGLKAIRGNLR